MNLVHTEVPNIQIARDAMSGFARSVYLESFLIDLSVAWQIIKQVCEFTELEFKYLNELMGKRAY